MPTYRFINTETNEVFEEYMSLSERAPFLADNPHFTQMPPTQMNIVRGVMGQESLKTDGGWQETLSRIAEGNPNSALADEQGGRSIKESKTRNAVEKWRAKRSAAGDTT